MSLDLRAPRDLTDAELDAIGVQRVTITGASTVTVQLFRTLFDGSRRLIASRTVPTGYDPSPPVVFQMPDFWSMVGIPEEWGPEGINAGPMTTEQYAEAARKRLQLIDNRP